MSEPRSDILNQILATKQREIAERKQQISADELRQQANHVSPPRGFVAAMHRRVEHGGAAVIGNPAQHRVPKTEDLAPLCQLLAHEGLDLGRVTGSDAPNERQAGLVGPTM